MKKRKTITASKNKSETIVLAQMDDWEGLYVYGKLVDQNHHIKVKDIFDCINDLNTIIRAEIKEVDTDWFDENGEFPEELSEVKFKE